MKPEVSIIIPCYNQAHYLPEAVGSVVNQTLTHWECIIVNDGSGDNTPRIANSLIMQYSEKQIRLINQENKGLAEARNTGIKIYFPLEFLIPTFLASAKPLFSWFISRICFSEYCIIKEFAIWGVLSLLPSLTIIHSQ